MILRCEILGMSDVQDVGCLRFGMLGCGMFRMYDLQDVIC